MRAGGVNVIIAKIGPAIFHRASRRNHVRHLSSAQFTLALETEMDSSQSPVTASILSSPYARSLIVINSFQLAPSSIANPTVLRPGVSPEPR